MSNADYKLAMFYLDGIEAELNAIAKYVGHVDIHRFF
jgi:hypothetical protein